MLMAKTTEDFLMSGETARRLGVSTQAVMDFINRGDLPVAGRTSAGYNLFRASDVERLAEQRRKHPPKRGRKKATKVTKKKGRSRTKK